MSAGTPRRASLARTVTAVMPLAWFVALTTVVGAAAGLLVATLQPATYRARATVLVETRSSPLAPTSGQSAGASTPTEVAILEGTAVRRRVIDELGTAPAIVTEAVPGSRAVQVSAESTDPQRAAQVVNAYMAAYVESRRARTSAAQQSLTTELEAAIADLDARLDALQQRVLAAPQGPARQAAVVDITAERRRLTEQRRTFAGRLDDVTLYGTAGGTDAQVLVPALAPTAPVEPQRRRSVLAGAAGGLVLGVGLVLLRRHLDTTVRDRDDLARVLPQPIEIIGRVPAVPGDLLSGPVGVLAPSSTGAEAYRSIRTALHFARRDHPFRSLLVTSAVPGEGKTSTVVNLAVALARTGQRIVMVDGDLQHPSLHEPFGASSDAGLVSLLLGNGQPTDRAQLVGAGEGLPLNLLAAGAGPDTPAELLAAGPTGLLVDALAGACDLVVLDSPPVLTGADAVVLSRCVDAVLFVVRSGWTSGRQVRAALDRLHRAGAPVVGIVLNHVDESLPGAAPGGPKPWTRTGSMPGRALRTGR